jgi:hypothetical protein
MPNNYLLINYLLLFMNDVVTRDNHQFLLAYGCYLIMLSVNLFLVFSIIKYHVCYGLGLCVTVAYIIVYSYSY